MSYKKKWISAIIIILLLSASGGFFLINHFFVAQNPPPDSLNKQAPGEFGDYFYLRIYYPVRNRMLFREKRLKKRLKQMAIAEAVIEEFFKGPEDFEVSGIPKEVKLLGLYRDPDQILYIDLSDEFRRNFRGDALAEYLILKSLYESLISNLQEFRDFKILVEGREIESLGGHFYLNATLNKTVLYEYAGEKMISHE